MSKVIQSTKNDTARKIAAVSSQLRATSPSVEQHEDHDEDHGSIPFYTVWWPRFGSLPYSHDYMTSCPEVDVVGATFEAARVVVAWDLGFQFDTVAIRLLLKERICDLIANHRPKVISRTTIKVHGELSDTTYLVLSYSGPVAYARHSHNSVHHVLATYGEMDRDGIDSVCHSMSESCRDFAQKEALKIARAICNKHASLIRDVSYILLGQGHITWKQFQEAIKRAGPDQEVTH